MSINIKKIIEQKRNENIKKIEKKDILKPNIASGSFEKVENSNFILSSMSEFIKNGEMVKSDRTLINGNDTFSSRLLPAYIEFSKSLDGNNGFKIQDGDCLIEIKPTIDSTIIGKVVEEEPGKVVYDLFNNSQLAVHAKENGIFIEWELNSYSSLSANELRRYYNFSCTNCVADYNEKTGIISFTKNNGDIIYQIKRPYIIAGNKSTYRNCGFNMKESNVSNGIFYAYINNKWIESASPTLPIKLILAVEKKQKYAIYMQGMRNGYTTDSVNSSFYLGRKDAKTYSLNLKVDTESVIKTLSQRDIKSFHVILNLYYKEGIRMPDSPGFTVSCLGEEILVDELNSENGNLAIDITKQIAQRYRSWLNGGYTPDNLSININYLSSVVGGSFSEPILADGDYVEIFNIDSADITKRPCISLAMEDDGSVKEGTPTKTISMGEAGNSSINLFTGQLAHDINLGTFTDGNISLPIALHYDTRLVNNKIAPKSFGKGWMLSLERMLIKDSSSEKTLGEKRRAYLDENGNKHYLDEKWYYEEGKTKHLVDKKDVYLDNDQKLKIDIKNELGEVISKKEIKYEVDDSEGIMLISAAASENYLNKSDLKLNLSKSSIEYKIGFKKFVAQGLSDGMVNVKAFYKTRSNSEISDIEWAKDYIETLRDNKVIVEFIDPKNVRFDKNDCPTTINGEKLSTMDINVTFTIADGGIVLLYPKYRIYLQKADTALGNEYIERGLCEYPAALKKIYSISTKEVNDYKSTEDLQKIESQIQQVENSIKQVSEALMSCRSNLASNISKIEHAKVSNELLGKNQSSYNKEQHIYTLLSYSEEKETILSQIKTYNNQLLDLITQKESLLEQKDSLINKSKEEATDYVADENGNYLVFDYAGKMIGATDSKENTIQINYEKDKITSIQGKAKESLVVHYDNNGNPEYMQLQDGRRIEFVYENNLLSEIKWLKERGRKASVEFKYDNSKKLVAIMYPDIKIEKLVYSNNRITGVTTELLAESISDEITKVSKPIKDESYRITKKDQSVLLEDLIFNVSEEYYLDLNGRLVTSEIKNGKKTDYKLSNYNENGEVYSLSCCYHDYDGQIKDKIAEFYFENSLSNLFEASISVQKIGTAFGRIYRSKLKKGALIAFMQKISPKAIICPTLFRCLITVTQYEGIKEIVSSSFTFDEVKNGFLVAPFRLKENATKVKFTLNSFDSALDSSKLEMARIYNVEGSVNTYDDEGRLIKTESNDGVIEYSSFFKKNPTMSIATDNYGRQKTSNIRIDGSGKTILSKDGDGNCVSYSYDEEGRVNKRSEYNEKDPTSCSVTKYTYSEKGVVSEVSGNLRNDKGEFPSRKTEYDPYTGLINKEINPNGQTVIHGYDPNSFDETAISSDDEGRANLTFKEYNHGLLTKLSHEGASFIYGYDGNGRKTFIALGNKENKLVTYEHLDARNDSALAKSYLRIEKSKTLDGYESESTYDWFDRLTKQKYGKYNFSYSYDANGNVLSESDEENKINYTYMYNNDNQQISVSAKDGDVLVKKEFEYDSYDRNNKVTISFDNALIFTNMLNYDDNDKIINLSTTYGDRNLSMDYSYNADDTIKTKELHLDDKVLVTSYDYLRQDEHATGLVSNYKVYFNNESFINQKLTYCVSGNITSIKSKDNLTTYKYDKLSRLIKEENSSLNKIFEYSYDNAGNIIESIENTNDKLVTKTYSYGNGLWRDQLSSLKIQKENEVETLLFEYDIMGRPTKYANKEVEWNLDGTLKSFDNNKFLYNSKGIRIGKNNEKYILDGNKVLRIIKDNNTVLDFIYSGEKIEGFAYKENTYLFIRDALNNVIAIIDSTSSKVVTRYNYDAWGRHEIRDENNNVVVDLDGTIYNKYVDTINEFIGYINPIRYRGYFFDNETSLYYLNARYYDPKLGRFISPDTLSILDDTMGEINGLNLYMYCKDNPVMYADPSGNMALICALLLLGCIGLVSNVAGQALNDLAYHNEFNIGNYLVAAGAGFIGGLFYAIPDFGGVISAAVTSGLTTAGQMAISGEKYDVADYLIMAGGSALLSGATAFAFGKISDKIPFFKDSNYILNNFIEFATDSGGITLNPKVLIQAAGQISIRESVAGFVGSPFSGLPSYFDEVYRLRRLGLSISESFKYAL